MSGDHIFGPILFRGTGGAEKKREVKFPAIYFVWLIRRKKQQNEFFSSCFGKDGRIMKCALTLIKCSVNQN